MQTLKKDKPNRSRKLLVRVPNWLGDTLMATPAVSEITRIFPEADISILARKPFAGFWENFPGIRKVYSLGENRRFYAHWTAVREIQREGFDTALVFPTSFSSAFLVFAAGIPTRIGWGGEGRDLFLTRVVPYENPRQKHLVWEYLDLVQKGFGLKSAAKTFRLSSVLTLGAREKADQLELNRKGNYLAFCPGATYGAAKRWPFAYWLELAQKLGKSRKETLLILGGAGDEAFLGDLKKGLETSGDGRFQWLVGKTDMLTLAEVLSRCRLLVTSDTGPMHMAAAVGTPTVALFGSTSPAWTRPFGKGHEVIHKEIECSPCFQRTCPIGYACLNAISVEEVYKVIRKKLSHPGRVRAENRGEVPSHETHSSGQAPAHR